MILFRLSSSTYFIKLFILLKLILICFAIRNAKSLVKRLLTHDLGKRYGNLRDGAADVKNHRWFEGLDWEDLKKKKLPVPYKPTVRVRSSKIRYRDD